MSSPPTLSLVGKVAIVTGSGRENSIGAGIALALARAGAQVAVNYVSSSTAVRAEKVVSTIKAAAGEHSVIAVQQDLTATDGPVSLVQATLEGFGVDHVDILGQSSIQIVA
jgi:NAD(P)-dependent dehydrogenase (short-subunit alcohol dehydrogenase family)